MKDDHEDVSIWTLGKSCENKKLHFRPNLSFKNTDQGLINN